MAIHKKKTTFWLWLTSQMFNYKPNWLYLAVVTVDVVDYRLFLLFYDRTPSCPVLYIPGEPPNQHQGLQSYLHMKLQQRRANIGDVDDEPHSVYLPLKIHFLNKLISNVLNSLFVAVRSLYSAVVFFYNPRSNDGWQKLRHESWTGVFLQDWHLLLSSHLLSNNVEIRKRS